MAFYQSSATNPNDVVSQIATFLQSNGYTFVRTRTELINATNILTYTLQCPDGTYITFLSSDGIERPFHPETESVLDYYRSDAWIGTSGTSNRPCKDAFNGRWITEWDGEDLSSYARPWVGCIRHLTYDVTKNWVDQPDAKRVYKSTGGAYYDDPESVNSYSALVVGYTTPNLYIFVNTNPDCVHIVTEYEDNKYSHMTIGNLEKSHSYVGGQYIVGSCQTVDGRNDYTGYLPYCLEDKDGVYALQRFAGGVYCEGDGTSWYTGDNYEAMKGWGRVIFTTGCHVAEGSGNDIIDWSATALDFIASTDGYATNTLGLPLAQGLSTPWYDGTTAWLNGGNSILGSTFDLQTGQAAPIPLSSWCEHEVAGAVYLGSWVHVGLIQMSAFRGKEEFVLGGDTYQVFPLNHIPEGSNDHMGKFRVNPDGAFEHNVTKTPECGLYMLGLAIRKTV